MNEILFKPDMHRAIREDRKTVTRRDESLEWINADPDAVEYVGMKEGCAIFNKLRNARMTSEFSLRKRPVKFEGAYPNVLFYFKPRYHVGEVVYIKEAWATEKKYDELPPRDIPQDAVIFYVIDGVGEWPVDRTIGKLRSPMFLRKDFARDFIQITGVRAERLQEITETEAEKEGFNCWEYNNPDAYADCPCLNQFIQRWGSINKKNPWSINPFVWRYEFKRVSQPPHSKVLFAYGVKSYNFSKGGETWV